MTLSIGGICDSGCKSAKKKNVKLIRQLPDGNREVIVFDLRQETALDASEMILRDKDIVYVEPKAINQFTDAITPYSSILSIVLSVGTAVLLIWNSTR